MSEDGSVMVQAAVQQYGPYLCRIIVHQIAGEAARSDLNTLSEPLKKLVFHQPHVKQWLSDALENSLSPSSKVGSIERRIWLQKIMQ